MTRTRCSAAAASSRSCWSAPPRPTRSRMPRRASRRSGAARSRPCSRRRARRRARSGSAGSRPELSGGRVCARPASARWRAARRRSSTSARGPCSSSRWGTRPLELFVFGAGLGRDPARRAAARLGWRVHVAGSAARFSSDAARFPGSRDLVRPRGELRGDRLDHVADRAAAVIMSHDLRRDGAALAAVLASRAHNIGGARSAPSPAESLRAPATRSPIRACTHLVGLDLGAPRRPPRSRPRSSPRSSRSVARRHRARDAAIAPRPPSRRRSSSARPGSPRDPRRRRDPRGRRIHASRAAAQAADRDRRRAARAPRRTPDARVALHARRRRARRVTAEIAPALADLDDHAARQPGVARRHGLVGACRRRVGRAPRRDRAAARRLRSARAVHRALRRADRGEPRRHQLGSMRSASSMPSVSRRSSRSTPSPRCPRCVATAVRATSSSAASRSHCPMASATSTRRPIYNAGS